MFNYAVALQGRGNQDAVLDAIRAGASVADFERLRAAYAYASAGGAYVLARTLSEAIPGWANMDKRWLVSIDFGHTDPKALEYLAALGNSQVRIPYATEVLANNLLPARCFHPKTLLLDRGAAPNSPPFMVAIGSANLTVSGMRTGHEDVAVASWTRGRLNASARAQLGAAQLQAAQMDRVWRTARRLDSRLLTDYVARRTRRPRLPSEDATTRVRAIEQDLVFAFPRLAAVAAASRLWVEIRRVNRNLGPGREGNQIDLQHGTRVFFGLNPRRVPTNSPLGSLQIRYGIHTPIKRMRFGDNSMDKLDLPIPTLEGPDTYEDSVLLFTKRGGDVFELTVGTPARITAWKRESRAADCLYRMHSGREWGVLP